MSEWLKEMRCKRIGYAYAGSNPAPPTDRTCKAGCQAQLAQLVEHLHGKEGVVGSSPTLGSRHLQGFLVAARTSPRPRGTKRVRTRRAAEAPSQRLKLDGGRGQFAGSRLLSSEMSDRRDAAFLRPDEAAALAGLSKRAIYRAIERGELRAARLCSRLRIPQAAFDDWVERCAVP